MPTAFTEVLSPPLAPPAHPPTKKWTRAECEVLESTGLFEGQKYELVEGELISKMGKKRPHVVSLSRLGDRMIEIFGKGFVNREAPIDVAVDDSEINEPEPDLIVLKREESHYLSRNPKPEDLLLVVEIAHSTVSFDLTTKAALYARAKIVECWVFDIGRRRLIVHRNPQSGEYMDRAEYAENETVAPLAAPNSSLRVGGIFPR